MAGKLSPKISLPATQRWWPVWKQLQFDITLKTRSRPTPLSKVPATESSRCLCAAITITLSSDGRTRTERLSRTKISPPTTPLWCRLETAAVRHNVKRLAPDRLRYQGASNGKFTLPVRKHDDDYTFIGWKNKDGKTFHGQNILTSDTTLVAVWKQLQFDITLKTVRSRLLTLPL